MIAYVSSGSASWPSSRHAKPVPIWDVRGSCCCSRCCLLFQGYFCMASGIGLGCGVAIDTIPRYGEHSVGSPTSKALLRLHQTPIYLMYLPQFSHQTSAHLTLRIATGGSPSSPIPLPAHRSAHPLSQAPPAPLPTASPNRPRSLLSPACSWAHLASWDAATKLLPTLGSCAVMMLTLEHVTHPLGLPAVMVAINLAFHATLLALGVSLQEAQAKGWAMPATVRAAGGGGSTWERLTGA